MPHFHFPLVSRKRHKEKIRELSREKERLEEQIDATNAELEKFRAAQKGEYVKSPRCRTCEHCLRYSEICGSLFGSYAECGLDYPQCKQYSPEK